MLKAREICITVAILLLLAQIAPIISASLNPPSLTATLRAGESVSESKEVFVSGMIPKADIMFAFDATGSMAGTIATAQAQAINIMNSLSTYITDVQYGVMSHRDYNGHYVSYGYTNQYGYMGDYPYNLTQPITSDRAAVKHAIDGLIAGYGYDYPESYTRVMYESYNDPAIGWRPESKHILLMLNDAIPHDDNINEGIPGAVGNYSTGGDPGRDTIMFSADDLGLQTVLAGMATNHVTLLVVRMSSDYFDYWKHWTEITGGSALLSSVSNIPSAIRVLVGGSAAHVHKLTLKAEEGYGAWLKPTSPLEYSEIDIPPEGLTKTFSINVTVPLGTAPGAYHFRIIADADGTNYGEEEVAITVLRAQWKLTVISAHDSPNPSVGDYVYDDGSSVTCRVTSPITEGNTVWTCTGWSGTGSVPASGNGISVTFSITQNSSITWNWQGTPIQWKLTVASAHDSPNPSAGDYMYNDSTLVTCNVTSLVIEDNMIWTCTGWSGTGSVPASGIGSSVAFSITQNSTVIWNWQGTPVQWELTVTSDHGSPNPAVGDHLYNDSDSVTCSVTSPVTEGETVWTCKGWVGTGSVPMSGNGSSTTFTITQNSSVTWNWQGTPIQWKLAIASNHDCPNPGRGNHMYNDSDSVTCKVTSSVTEGGTVWSCTGWTGTGSVPASGSGLSVTFVIIENSSITWKWRGTPIQWKLTVVSGHDCPVPSRGNHVYNNRASVTCKVTSPVTEGGTVWTCTGWTGTGSVPPSGCGSSVTFAITQNSTVTWHWRVVPKSVVPELRIGALSGIAACFAVLYSFRLVKRAKKMT